MRRHLAYPALLALLLAVAFAGCRREPLPGSRGAITFSVAPATISAEETKAATKADPSVKTDLIAVDQTVKVYGSYTGSDDPLFDGVTLTCKSVSAAGSTWEYTPLKYWSENGTHSFRAVFPADAANQVYSVAADKLTVSDYSLENGYDLMVASAQQESATRTSDKVTLRFRHACAAVRFLFGKGADDEAIYKIKELTLQNLSKTGTLEYEGASKDDDVSMAEWTPDARVASAFAWSGTWTVPAPSTEAPFKPMDDWEWIFAVPQALTVTGTDAAPILYLSYMAGDQEIHVTLPLVTSNSTKIETWLPGKMYTYKILLNPNAIELSVGWTEWTTKEFNLPIK